MTRSALVGSGRQCLVRSLIEVWRDLIAVQRVGCCEAGRQAYPGPCPWHGGSTAGCTRGGRDVDEETVVGDKGHEVVGQMPGTQERPPDALPRGAQLEDVREGEHAALRVRLGLAPAADWPAILAAVEEVTAPPAPPPQPLGFFEHVAQELGMKLSDSDDAVVAKLHEKLLRLANLGDQLAVHDGDQLALAVEVEERAGAVERAYALMRTPEEQSPALDEVVALAEYLRTGDQIPAASAIERMQNRSTPPLSEDAATWSAAERR